MYPKELCEAIIRGLKRQLEKDHHISNVEEMIGGPVPGDNVEWDRQMELFDATSGAELDPTLVKAAREEELKWIHKEGVYVRVPGRECEGTLLKLKCVDVKQGDSKNPKVRSRIVA